MNKFLEYINSLQQQIKFLTKYLAAHKALAIASSIALGVAGIGGYNFLNEPQTVTPPSLVSLPDTEEQPITPPVPAELGQKNAKKPIRELGQNREDNITLVAEFTTEVNKSHSNLCECGKKLGRSSIQSKLPFENALTQTEIDTNKKYLENIKLEEQERSKLVKNSVDSCKFHPPANTQVLKALSPKNLEVNFNYLKNTSTQVNDKLNTCNALLERSSSKVSGKYIDEVFEDDEEKNDRLEASLSPEMKKYLAAQKVVEDRNLKICECKKLGSGTTENEKFCDKNDNQFLSHPSNQYVNRTKIETLESVTKLSPKELIEKYTNIKKLDTATQDYLDKCVVTNNQIFSNLFTKINNFHDRNNKLKEYLSRCHKDYISAHPELFPEKSDLTNLKSINEATSAYLKIENIVLQNGFFFEKNFKPNCDQNNPSATRTTAGSQN